MKWLAAVALVAFALSSGASDAAQQSVSYSTWTVSGKIVTLRYVLPESEAERLIGTDLAVVTTKRLGEYLLRNVGARSPSGDCTVMDQGYDLGLVDPLAVGPGLYGFEIFFHCAEPDRIVLRNNALFARDSDHVDIARIYVNGQPSQQIFTSRRQRIAIPQDNPLAPESFLSYVALGAGHFFDGIDRLCVLLGLVLLVRRWRDVGYVAGALTLGYALSVAVSSVGWVAPRLTLVDAFVGGLVALLGLGLAVRRIEQPRNIVIGWSALLLLAGVVCAFTRFVPEALLLLGGAALSAGLLALGDRREGVSWLVLAALLGFLDGFVWSAAIEPAELPASDLLEMAAGLDAGALVVAIVLVGALFGVFQLARAPRFRLPRPLVNDLCAAGLAGLGTYWLVTRLFM